MFISLSNGQHITTPVNKTQKRTYMGLPILIKLQIFCKAIHFNLVYTLTLH